MRRSELLLRAVLAGALLVPAVVAGAAAQAPSPTTPDGWTRVTQDGFSIAFPLAPTMSESEVETAYAGTITNHYVATDLGALGILQVNFSDWPADYVAGSGGSQGMLGTFCRQFQPATGTVERCASTTLAGAAALAIRDTDEVAMEGRMLYVGTRQFQLWTIGDVVGWTDDFFASFQLVDAEPSPDASPTSSSSLAP